MAIAGIQRISPYTIQTDLTHLIGASRFGLTQTGVRLVSFSDMDGN
ncbi:hypothetical protein HMPREF1255_1804 [Propionimicrobium sp. BV2F7]|nr:hypothetical protein HMPREF1255_1804 [Propionimicrobium sp. BV2F7]